MFSEVISRRRFLTKTGKLLEGIPLVGFGYDFGLDFEIPAFEQTPNQIEEKPPEIIKYNAPDIFRTGDKTQPYIYLTFDDCWLP